MKPILEVRGIGKKYKISHQSTRYLSIRERLLNIFEREKQEDFWALRDVSFSVQLGESVGVIGRNGAGKSTLLKILSKITPPTLGSIVKRGRIASLLEVGTGFHPELTGRENIFLNGSLLGMKKTEIMEKFDEIVDFSGVEKFLDTPLKHYSSGMQLRLAFSVAAFLNPEVLIIDEVLAVGDAEFQKRCLGKMEDVSKSGRTIIFVSHQLGIVSKLCRQAILLESGKVTSIGASDAVIGMYMDQVSIQNEFADDRTSSSAFHFTRARTMDRELQPASAFGHDQSITVEIVLFAKQQPKNVHLLIAANNKNGQRIFSSDISLEKYSLRIDDHNVFYVTIPAETLTPGNYSFFMAIHAPNAVGYDVKDQLCPISIYDNGSNFNLYENKWFYGDVFVECTWVFK
jgi:lipopolysaccharide transport system ATP-binding protein